MPNKKEKEVDKKFEKVIEEPKIEPYAEIPDALYRFTRAVTRPTPLKEEHYQGLMEWEELGLLRTWQREDVRYGQDKNGEALLRGKSPRMMVLTDKIMLALFDLGWTQQYGKEKVKAEVTFNPTIIGKYLYPDKKIEGSIITNIKECIFTLFTTATDTPHPEKKNKRVIGYLFNIEYDTEKIKQDWIGHFNYPWNEYFTKGVSKEIRRHFRPLLKELADPITTKNPTIHFLIKLIVLDKQSDYIWSKPRRIDNLLRECFVDLEVIKRPKSTYELLQRNLSYIAKEYPDDLQQIKIMNPKDRSKKWVIAGIKALDKLDYIALKKYLKNSTGLDDIRECLISFGRAETKTSPDKATSRDIIEDYIVWRRKVEATLDEPMKHDEDHTRRFLRGVQKYLGTDYLVRKYNAECNSINANYFICLGQMNKDLAKSRAYKETGRKEIVEAYKKARNEVDTSDDIPSKARNDRREKRDNDEATDEEDIENIDF